MKKKTALIVTLAILCAAAIGIYFYFNVDMTGASFDEIEDFLLENCIHGDLLITMGAGDVVNIGEKLLGL